MHESNSRQSAASNASIRVLTARDAGIPSSAMRLRMLHASRASMSCAPGVTPMQPTANDPLVAHERVLSADLLMVARPPLPLASSNLANASHGPVSRTRSTRSNANAGSPRLDAATTGTGAAEPAPARWLDPSICAALRDAPKAWHSTARSPRRLVRQRLMETRIDSLIQLSPHRGAYRSF